MSNVLSMIYRSEWRVMELSDDSTAEFRRLCCCLSEMEDELSRQLPPDVKEKFREYVSLRSKMLDVSGEEDFIEGFRLGAHLMMAALRGVST